MKLTTIDHLVYFVKNLKAAEKFYTALLGKVEYRDAEQIAYAVGETRVFFALPYDKKAGKQGADKIGFNHIAFGVSSVAKLRAIEEGLDKLKYKHSGIMLDEYAQEPFIWLDDTDGNRVEIYCRTA